MIKRIAMWSGPRNISTAMMRSWQARGDTHVVDEPFYAYYLSETGLDHPDAAEVIEVHESNWKKVVDSLQSNPPLSLSIFYQKHMAHHLLANIDRAWICGMTGFNSFPLSISRLLRESILSNATISSLKVVFFNRSG